jgi:hypothetical protein
MTEEIDIVTLVINNPLTKLSSDYGSKIIHKIKETFTNEEQKLFVGNFYAYLNYDNKNDFVINLESIWKWLGYSRIEECKRCLVKNFIENKDYKIEKAAPQIGGAKTKPSEDDEKEEIFFPEVAGKKTKPSEDDEKEKAAPPISGTALVSE